MQKNITFEIDNYNTEMKDILKYLATFKFWKELFIMTAGMMIAAGAVYFFMLPSKLVLGSITGLSIVISNLFSMAGIELKVSLVVTVIN
ncbi:MAG: YitT family protein, partial [Bacteroidales bacterium]|nr:YitT family protein [Bacteroidales bacterium]